MQAPQRRFLDIARAREIDRTEYGEELSPLYYDEAGESRREDKSLNVNEGVSHRCAINDTTRLCEPDTEGGLNRARTRS